MRDCLITGVEVVDVRFPTSRTLAGSDAMNEAPDYSAAYAIVLTDGELRGRGMTFTIGRGTEVVVAAIAALAPLVQGRRLADLAADPRAFWRELTGDSQLRWIGPEKGVIHLATAALVNAVWDLWAQGGGQAAVEAGRRHEPGAARRLCRLSLHHRCRSRPSRRSTCSTRAQPESPQREREMRRDGFPAYTTSVGWLGFSDDEVLGRCRTAVEQGWTHMKMKVGGDLDDDRRRATLIRAEIGPERFLMMDANQVWDVDQAIARHAGAR